MSIMGPRARELVSGYNDSLEQQIQRGGSSLACQHEELRKKVEDLLRDGDPQETHCLGLDPLAVMEESLRTAAPARGALEALAKAFQVLEQAALNLYLGHWREEYKVVKMYSGMFTHFIKPVLSMPQVTQLFGLLGYQLSTGWHEQLLLQSARVTQASLDNLLHLSCSFFLARCECRLLLSALGNRGGETQWELAVVRERQRGHSVKVAVKNTKKLLCVDPPPKEDVLKLTGIDAGQDLDLYTDEQLNGGQRDVSEEEDESPKWGNLNMHNNGTTCSSTSVPQEPPCGSTLNYQVSKTAPQRPNAARSPKHGRCSQEELTKLAVDKAALQPRGLKPHAMGVCKSELLAQGCCCVQPNALRSQLCTECNPHASLLSKGQSVPVPDEITDDTKESKQASSQSGSLRVEGASQTFAIDTATSSALCEDPDSTSRRPIAFHDCCNLAHPDPKSLCLSCWVFHSGTCKEVDYCQNYHHVESLDRCSICSGRCVRKPLVLCRYCGAEYCSECWYRHPVICTCGQTFDQSSSV